MQTSRAQGLLLRCLVRAACAAAIASLMACLVPPEGPTTSSSDIPPEILSAEPKEPVLLRSRESCSFPVSVLVNDRDRNDPMLLIRAVADNRIAGRRKLIEQRPQILPSPRRPIQVRFRIDTIQHFEPAEVNVLSIFVTDAADYVVSEADVTTSTRTDLGEIQPDPDGDRVIDHSVVEYRWAVQITPDEGVCPQQ